MPGYQRGRLFAANNIRYGGAPTKSSIHLVGVPLGTKKSTPDDKFVIDARLSMCVDFSQLITSVMATPLGSKPLPKLNPPRRSSR